MPATLSSHAHASSSGAATSVTVSATVAYGEQLLVFASAESSPITLTSVTFGGVGGVRVGNYQSPTYKGEWWAWTAPTPATANVVVTSPSSVKLAVTAYSIAAGASLIGGGFSIGWQHAFLGPTTAPRGKVSSWVGEALGLAVMLTSVNSQTISAPTGGTDLFKDTGVANTNIHQAGASGTVTGPGNFFAAGWEPAWTLGTADTWLVAAGSIGDGAVVTTPSQILIGRAPSHGSSGSDLYTSFPRAGGGWSTFDTPIRQQVRVLVPGTLRNFAVRLRSDPGGGHTRTLTIQKDGADTGLSVTISGGGSLVGIDTGSESFLGTHTWGIKESSTAGAAAGSWEWQAEFVPTTPGESVYGGHSGDTLSTSPVYNSVLYPITRSTWLSTADSWMRSVVAVAGTLVEYAIWADVDPGGGRVYEFYLYKIATDGTRTKQDGTGGSVDSHLTYTAGSGAANVTKVCNLPLLPGEAVEIEGQITSGTAAGSFRPSISARFMATTIGQYNIGGHNDNPGATPTYLVPAGSGNNSDDESTTESDAAFQIHAPGLQVSGLYVLLDTQQGASKSWVLRLRKNLASAGLGDITITHPDVLGSVTGGPIALVATDTFDIESASLTSGGAGGGFGWALAGGDAVAVASGFLKVTQLVAHLAYDEDAEDDAPPAADPCSGDGTVASGTNPSDGASLATATVPHAWIEVTIDGTTYRWAKVNINHGNPRSPRVLSFGPMTRALTDGQGGFESAAATVRLSDYDRVLRGLHATQALINQAASIYVADEATIRAGGNPWRAFRGVIRDITPESELEYVLELEDPLTLSMSAFAQEALVPKILVSDVPSISDNNPLEPLTDTPVPLCYGSLSDEDESPPTGTVLAPFIAAETVDIDAGNTYKFMVCRGACANIHNIYFGDPYQNPPVSRAPVGASEYGVRVYSPHHPGWFHTFDYTDQGGYRFTFIFVDQTHPGAELARQGKIPMIVNLCGREEDGDATGNMISSLPRQFLHFLNNEVAQVATGVWLSMAQFDGFSLFDTQSFETVKDRSEDRITGGYLGAFVLGHGGRQITLREAIAQFCRSGDFDLGITRHGQIMLTMLDRTATASAATTFTDYQHVIKDSFRIDPKIDEVENTIRYVYKRNYVPALQQLNPIEGTRLPREPYDGEWLSGLQTMDDATAISDLGETRASQVIEMEMVRDSGTADDVAQQRLARQKNPNGRAEVEFAVRIGDGLGIELGDLIKLTHFQGLSATGWTGRRLQVRRLTTDLDEMTVTIGARDVEDLLS